MNNSPHDKAVVYTEKKFNICYLKFVGSYSTNIIFKQKYKQNFFFALYNK